MMIVLPVVAVLAGAMNGNAFSAPAKTSPFRPVVTIQRRSFGTVARMVEERESSDSAAVETAALDSAVSIAPEDSTVASGTDAMEQAMREQEEKIRRSDELRAQEVFMKRSTGVHKCGNCDWEYNEAKGDTGVIGGTVKPGTPFSELPSNWRCPVCRASKDSFSEIVEEIPGFEVNQGYGFGTNSLTAGQKSGLVFGGLFFFFLLFLSGYALS